MGYTLQPLLALPAAQGRGEAVLAEGGECCGAGGKVRRPRGCNGGLTARPWAPGFLSEVSWPLGPGRTPSLWCSCLLEPVGELSNGPHEESLPTSTRRRTARRKCSRRCIGIKPNTPLDRRADKGTKRPKCSCSSSGSQVLHLEDGVGWGGLGAALQGPGFRRVPLHQSGPVTPQGLC